MDLFLSSPWPIVAIAGTVEAVLAIALCFTGRGRYLIAMGAVAAAALVGVAIERLIETDREKIERLLETARGALEANDKAKLLATIAPSAKGIRTAIDSAMRLGKFSETNIHNVVVEVNRTVSPPTAVAKFVAVASYAERQGVVAVSGYPMDVVATLKETPEGWLIYEVLARPLSLGNQAAPVDYTEHFK